MTTEVVSLISTIYELKEKFVNQYRIEPNTISLDEDTYYSLFSDSPSLFTVSTHTHAMYFKGYLVRIVKNSDRPLISLSIELAA